MSPAVETGGESVQVGSVRNPAPLPDGTLPSSACLCSDDSTPFGGTPGPAIATPATPVASKIHRHGLLQAFQSLVYIIVIALFIMTFTVQPFRIPSESMEPTLLVGDFLLVNKQKVADQKGGLHRFGGNAEGLHREGHDEERDDDDVNQ